MRKKLLGAVGLGIGLGTFGVAPLVAMIQDKQYEADLLRQRNQMVIGFSTDHAKTLAWSQLQPFCENFKQLTDALNARELAKGGLYRQTFGEEALCQKHEQVSKGAGSDASPD